MNANDYCRRLGFLETKRTFIEPYWSDAFDATFPLMGQLIRTTGATDGGAATAHSKKIQTYDATLRRAVRMLAAAFQSGLTPAGSQWLQVGTIMDGDHAGKQWLSEASRMVWEAIHDCNFDIVSYLGHMFYIISGHQAMYIEEGNLDNGKVFNFRLWPLHSCFFADSTGKGMIDTVYRKFQLTAEQAMIEYTDPKYQLPADVAKIAEKNPYELLPFCQAIHPAAKEKNKKQRYPIESTHIYLKGRKIVRRSGYFEMPVICPAWMPTPDSVYSEGLVGDAMPDHYTLNEVKRMILMNADLAISGMWGAVDDGVINPKTVKVGPRKIVMMANKDNFFPLKSAADFNVAQLQIDNLQRSIKETMMSDQLHPEKGPAMTATEINMRREILRSLLGPEFARLQAEYLNGIVERCFGIAYRASLKNPNILPAVPESLKGQLTKIAYKSPIARAQRLEDVAAMDRFELSLLNNAKTGVKEAIEVIDIYDLDAAGKERADYLGVPAKLIRSDDDIKKRRDERQAQLQQAQEAQHAAEMQKAIAPTIAKGAAANAQ